MKNSIISALLYVNLALFGGCAVNRDPRQEGINSVKKYFHQEKNPLEPLYKKYPGMQQSLECEIYSLDSRIIDEVAKDSYSGLLADSDMRMTDNPKIVNMLINETTKIECKIDSIYNLNRNEEQLLENYLETGYLVNSFEKK